MSIAGDMSGASSGGLKLGKMFNYDIGLNVNFLPICKYSTISSACIIHELDDTPEGADASVNYYIFKTSNCLSNQISISDLSNANYNPENISGGTFTSLITDSSSSNNFVTVSYPTNCGQGKRYVMYNLTDKLNKNISLDKGDFIFAAINIPEDNSFSVTNTILRLCFNSSIFFFENECYLKVGKLGSETSNFTYGSDPGDNVFLNYQNYPLNLPRFMPFFREVDNSAIGSTPWTITFWFYNDYDGGNEQYVLYNGTFSATNRNSMYISRNSNGNIEFHYGSQGPGQGQIKLTSQNITVTKSWFFIAVTFDGSTTTTLDGTHFKLIFLEQFDTFPLDNSNNNHYTDGTAGTHNSVIKKYDSGDSYRFYFGGHSGGSTSIPTLPGLRSNLTIWNEELSYEELKLIYNDGFIGNIYDFNVPKPMHWWSFNHNLKNNVPVNYSPELNFFITDIQTFSHNHYECEYTTVLPPGNTPNSNIQFNLRVLNEGSFSYSQYIIRGRLTCYYGIGSKRDLRRLRVVAYIQSSCDHFEDDYKTLKTLGGATTGSVHINDKTSQDVDFSNNTLHIVKQSPISIAPMNKLYTHKLYYRLASGPSAELIDINSTIDFKCGWQSNDPQFLNYIDGGNVELSEGYSFQSSTGSFPFSDNQYINNSGFVLEYNDTNNYTDFNDPNWKSIYEYISNNNVDPDTGITPTQEYTHVEIPLLRTNTSSISAKAGDEENPFYLDYPTYSLVGTIPGSSIVAKRRPLFKFNLDLYEGITVINAEFAFYVPHNDDIGVSTSVYGPTDVNGFTVHKITRDWTPSTVTYNDLSTNYDSSPVSSIDFSYNPSGSKYKHRHWLPTYPEISNGFGYNSAITGLINGWISNDNSNNGIMLISSEINEEAGMLILYEKSYLTIAFDGNSVGYYNVKNYEVSSYEDISNISNSTPTTNDASYNYVVAYPITNLVYDKFTLKDSLNQAAITPLNDNIVDTKYYITSYVNSNQADQQHWMNITKEQITASTPYNVNDLSSINIWSQTDICANDISNGFGNIFNQEVDLSLNNTYYLNRWMKNASEIYTDPSSIPFSNAIELTSLRSGTTIDMSDNILFTDSNVGTGNELNYYGKNENYSITFNSGSTTNTIVLFFEETEFEHSESASTVYDYMQLYYGNTSNPTTQYQLFNGFNNNNNINAKYVPSFIPRLNNQFSLDLGTQYIKFEFTSDGSVQLAGWKIHVKFKNDIQNDWLNTLNATSSLCYISTIPHDASNQIPEQQHKLITSRTTIDISTGTPLENVNFSLGGSDNLNCVESIPFTANVLSYKIQDLSNNYNYRLHPHNSQGQELESYWDISSVNVYGGSQVIDGSYVNI